MKTHDGDDGDDGDGGDGDGRVRRAAWWCGGGGAARGAVWTACTHHAGSASMSAIISVRSGHFGAKNVPENTPESTLLSLFATNISHLSQYQLTHK